MSDPPPGVELRTAGPDDREAVVTLLHERMSSKFSLARWRRLFDYPWLSDRPDCGVVVLERGRISGYLAVIYAERRQGSRTVRTANLSSWYLAKPLRGQGVGLAMLQLATREPAVTYTTFSSNPPALRVMAKAGLVLLDDRRFLWRRTAAPAAGVAVLSGFDAVTPEVPDHERQILTDHRDLPVQPHLLRAAEGDCLIVLSVKRKGADVAYHEVLYLDRPEIFARHAAAFADAILTPGAAVLAVDRRFLDGCEVIAETEPISVPRYFRSQVMARREV
ncbi:MAG TPA: GNAT family N-acetyltransferase, partial [Geminicoccaceae bacterium]|nr:GNAT family N-acetyltransferase [Geminicoccaceae bacterium]